MFEQAESNIIKLSHSKRLRIMADAPWYAQNYAIYTNFTVQWMGQECTKRAQSVSTGYKLNTVKTGKKCEPELSDKKITKWKKVNNYVSPTELSQWMDGYPSRQPNACLLYTSRCV